MASKRLTCSILGVAILRIWNFCFRLGLSLLALFGHEREINGDLKKERILKRRIKNEAIKKENNQKHQSKQFKEQQEEQEKKGSNKGACWLKQWPE